ncbi:MAG: hypothetical protein JWP57_1666 [Spirosoma sp.]|nr:hypothetical protein [Spirosoma sp.]
MSFHRYHPWEPGKRVRWERTSQPNRSADGDKEGSASETPYQKVNELTWDQPKSLKVSRLKP